MIAQSPQQSIAQYGLSKSRIALAKVAGEHSSMALDYDYNEATGCKRMYRTVDAVLVLQAGLWDPECVSDFCSRQGSQGVCHHLLYVPKPRLLQAIAVCNAAVTACWSVTEWRPCQLWQRVSWRAAASPQLRGCSFRKLTARLVLPCAVCRSRLPACCPAQHPSISRSGRIRIDRDPPGGWMS